MWRGVLLSVLWLGCTPRTEVELRLDDGSFDDSVDFGYVELGQTKQRGLTIASRDLRLTLTRVVRMSGSPVRLRPWLDEADPVFILDQDLQPFVPTIGQKVKVLYDPPSVADETVHETKLALHFTASSGQTLTATLSLRGVAMNFTCGMPGPLDFGALAVGDQASLDYPFSNWRDVPDVVSFVPDLHFSNAFSVDALTPSTAFTLPPRSEHVAHLTFTPRSTESFSATVAISSSSLCPARVLSVTGGGVPSVLFVIGSPDFPWSPLSSRPSSVIRFQNLMRRPVTLTRASLRSGADFTWPDLPLPVPGAGATPDGQVLAGRLDLPITFTPSREGMLESWIDIETDVPSQPLISVQLRGRAGAPRAELTPGTLLLTAGTGTLTLRNVGTVAPAGEPGANLKLRPGSAYELRALMGGNVSEICVGAWDGSNCVGTLSSGLDGLASGEAMSIPIRVMPTSSGRSFELTVFTNDPDHPSSIAILEVP